MTTIYKTYGILDFLLSVTFVRCTDVFTLWVFLSDVVICITDAKHMYVICNDSGYRMDACISLTNAVWRVNQEHLRIQSELMVVETATESGTYHQMCAWLCQ